MNNQINSKIFVTEAVSEGHPDKVCDQIAEAILDWCLSIDVNVKLGCEILLADERLLIGGQIASDIILLGTEFEKNLNNLIEDVIKNKIKYDIHTWKSLSKLKVNFDIKKQSQEINHLVKVNEYLSSGDNSVTYGYAINRVKSNYFPPFQLLAQCILQKLANLRKNDEQWQEIWQFAPDGKVQIFANDHELFKVVLCHQFRYKLSPKKIIETEMMIKKILLELLEEFDLVFAKNFQLKLISFIKGGPDADTGLTGRKILVDTYGTYLPHGGGSFAGKDPTKTDRTLALFGRFIAKNLVAAQVLDEVTIQLSTTIGESFINNVIFLNVSSEKLPILHEIFDHFFNWNLAHIIKYLDLNKPQYFDLSKYGYFGRANLNLTWEKIDFAEIIKNWVKNK